MAQRTQCLLQLHGTGVFEQVAVGTTFKGLHDQLRVGVHGQDQYFAQGQGRLESAQRFEATGMTHRQVEQNDVRVQPFCHFQQLPAVIQLTNDRVARQVVDQCFDPGPNQQMVIHQQQVTGHGVLLRLARSRARRGHGSSTSI